MKILTFFIILSFFSSLQGQSDVSDSSLTIPMFYAAYSYQIPGGDMAERYGNNSAIGGGFQVKTHSNWIVGAEFQFLFGNNIKIADQIMNNLKTEDGNIIDMAGNFASYSLLERGYYLSARFGKLFPVLSPNPNSGILVSGGFGYLQHKIRIEVSNNSAPQIDGDYKRGYDRLAGGPCISEFIGYLYVGNSRLLNFYGGFEFNQAWTIAKRDVNFDTQKPDAVKNRFDVLSGFKIGWIMPLFRRMPEKIYFH